MFHFKINQLYLRPAWRKSSTALVMVGLMGALTACAASQAESTKDANRRAIPVVVAPVVQKDVPIKISATGNVQAFATVTVKSQVDGQLIDVYFKEGQAVKAGDLLFTIDPRSLQASQQQAIANQSKNQAQVKQAEANLAKARAQVAQAEANLAKSKAQALNAAADRDRYSTLYQQGSISRQQFEQYRTNAETASAAVQADQSAVANQVAAVAAAQADLDAAQALTSAGSAAIENANVQLSYTSIYAPIDGRTGNLNINRGNLIKANDANNALVTISQIKPIYVAFSIPERLLPDIKQRMARNKLKVEVSFPNSSAPSVQGDLTFVDSTVDTATGTILLKATFPNEQERLSPGQFVNVALLLKEQKQAILVPSQAVQIGQKGQYVFVMKPDNTVELRYIKTAEVIGAQTIVASGLNPEEKVVTDGQFNLTPGAKVEVKSPQKGKTETKSEDK